MKAKCIDNEDMEDLLDMGQIYDAEDYDFISYMVIHNPEMGAKCTFHRHRFEVIDDVISCDNEEEDEIINDFINNDKDKTYWNFDVKINTYNHTYSESGIVESDNKFFPLREVEEMYQEQYEDCNIIYTSVIEISKDDYNWKYAEMSKFEDGE